MKVYEELNFVILFQRELQKMEIYFGKKNLFNLTTGEGFLQLLEEHINPRITEM